MNPNNPGNRSNVQMETSQFIQECMADKQAFRRISEELVTVGSRLRSMLDNDINNLVQQSDQQRIQLEDEQTISESARLRAQEYVNLNDSISQQLAAEVRAHQQTRAELDRIRRQYESLCRLRMRNRSPPQ